MTAYAVIREAGPGWADGGIYDQPRVDEHAAFMSGLADSGLLVFAGPLAGTETGRVRVLLVFDAANEAEIHDCIADDPWAIEGLLVTSSVEPWLVIVGAERLAASRGGGGERAGEEAL